MADMPERIYANELSQLAIESKNRELALARLEAEVIAIRDRVQFLEKALGQLRATAEVHEYFLHEADAQDPDASWFELTLDAPITDVEHLAKYLKEKADE